MRSTTWRRGHWGTSMRWLITALIVFTLAGCGLARQAQIKQASDAAKLQGDRDLAGCDRLYPDKYRKPVTPRVKCRTAAYDKVDAAINRSGANVQLDIGKKHTAQMLVAAERFDKGELSKAEYDLALANNNVASKSQLLQRENGAAAVAAQQQAAAAASQAAIQSATQPRTRHTNCNTFGSTVNCTTY